MIKVGITGGIGSGKSTVSGIFQKLGIPIFFSDIEAAKLLISDKKIIDKIISTFGNDINFHGIIDRKKLAKIVFSDKINLEKLNAIVHPAVRKKFHQWEKKKKKTPFIIQEAAILIESGSHKDLDYLILVTAPEKLRIERVMKRDKISRKDVFARMKNQLPDSKKKKFADAIIVNDEKKLLMPQVLKIHNYLLSK